MVHCLNIGFPRVWHTYGYKTPNIGFLFWTCGKLRKMRDNILWNWSGCWNLYHNMWGSGYFSLYEKGKHNMWGSGVGVEIYTMDWWCYFDTRLVWELLCRWLIQFFFNLMIIKLQLQPFTWVSGYSGRKHYLCVSCDIFMVLSVQLQCWVGWLFPVLMLCS